MKPKAKIKRVKKNENIYFEIGQIAGKLAKKNPKNAEAYFELMVKIVNLLNKYFN